ncbi:hypothetical protein EDB19DRAFT_1831813 [Suillus lakei]|nr:hypothetical protein EDB19DRAFT_1831813 [Suillus lakei]
MLLLLSHMCMNVLPVAWYYLQTQEHCLHASSERCLPTLISCSLVVAHISSYYSAVVFNKWLPMPRAVVLVLSTISTWSALLSIWTSRGMIYVCQHTGNMPKAQALAKPDADALSNYSLLVPGRQKLACSDNLRCRPGLAYLRGCILISTTAGDYIRVFCLLGEAHYDLNQGQFNPIFAGRKTY